MVLLQLNGWDDMLCKEDLMNKNAEERTSFALFCKGSNGRKRLQQKGNAIRLNRNRSNYKKGERWF